MVVFCEQAIADAIDATVNELDILFDGDSSFVDADRAQYFALV